MNRFRRPSPAVPARTAVLVFAEAAGLALVLGAGPAPAAVAAPAAPGAAAPAAGVRVVDARGEPVAGARVEAFRPPRSGGLVAAATARLVDASTGDDGRLDVPVPALERVLWLVDHPGYSPAAVEAPAGPGPLLRLSRGGRLDGRLAVEPVAARDGRTGDAGLVAAAAGGRICATWQQRFDEFSRTRGWRRCTRLEEGGVFALAGLPAGPVTLRAEVPGYLPAELQASAGERVELLLERGVPLVGRVVDRGRRPVPGARVTAGPGLTAETGAAGRFTLAVPALPVKLTATSAGHRPAELRVGAEASEEGPAAATPPAEVVLTLDPGEALAATLLGEQSVPPAAAEAWLERLVAGEWRGERRRFELGEDGGLELELPAPGRYRLRLTAPGYRPLQRAAVDVGRGERVDLGVLGLDRGGVVAGRAVDAASGEPVAGAEAELLPAGAGVVAHVVRGRSLTAVTGADGRFEVAGVEPGGYRLTVRHPDHAAALRRVEVEGPGREDLGDLALGEGTLVSGVVVDRDGEPRPGLRVRLLDPDGSPLAPLGEWWTAADGAFDGQAVEPGRYRVRVDGERLLLAQEIEVPGGEPEHELRLVAGGVELAGIVHRGGEPLAGGALTLVSDLDPGAHRGKVILRGGGELAGSGGALGLSESRLTAEIGLDGTFHAEDAPAGRLWATVYDDAGGVTTRELSVPDRARAWVEIDLAGVDLAGRTVDAASGLGVAARIALYGLSGRPVAETAAGPEGRFRLPDLAPGRYALEAAAEGYRPAAVAELAVTPGAPPVELALEPGGDGAVAVRLVRADGSPAAGVPVTLLDATGRMVRSLLTDALGVRRYDRLAPGTYAAVWSDALAGTGTAGPLTVAESETVNVDRVLGRGTPLTVVCRRDGCAGTAVQALGVYPVDQGVEISPYLDGVSAGLRFSAAGVLPLGRLAAGVYLVDLAAAGERWQQVVAVTGGDGSLVVVE